MAAEMEYCSAGMMVGMMAVDLVVYLDESSVVSMAVSLVDCLVGC